MTERREEKEKQKHPEKLRKWSITKTIVEENIECDVTIKVKYIECIGHVSPLHLLPSCLIFYAIICFLNRMYIHIQFHFILFACCVCLYQYVSIEVFNFLFNFFFDFFPFSVESKKNSSKFQPKECRDGIMGLRK